MSRNDGGPAFPQTRDYQPGYADGPQVAPRGMSLRDYFAAQAMAAIMGKAPFGIVREGDATAEARFAEAVRFTAVGAYEYADAMLSERAK